MEFNTKLSKLIARRNAIIKSVLYSLKKKRFISNYKDKHNNIIKGCYIIK